MSNSYEKVLITGASSGIGRGLAKWWAKRGATVWATARRTKNLNELAAEGNGKPFDRAEYAARRDAAGRQGGGPEAERQLELGPEAAVREIAELTLG